MLDNKDVLTQDQMMTCLDPDGNFIIYKSFQQWDYALLRKGLDNKWAVAFVGSRESMRELFIKKTAAPSRISYSVAGFVKVGA